jgi:hypothetical protein
MNVHPATTRVIKAGRSRTPFLLFFGNRKQDENEPVKPGTTVLAVVLLVTAILGICIYAFLTGKLG